MGLIHIVLRVGMSGLYLMRRGLFCIVCRRRGIGIWFCARRDSGLVPGGAKDGTVEATLMGDPKEFLY